MPDREPVPCGGIKGRCPHSAVAPAIESTPSRVARRGGAPWRCSSCLYAARVQLTAQVKRSVVYRLRCGVHVADIARAIGCSSSVVWQWIARGRGGATAYRLVARAFDEGQAALRSEELELARQAKRMIRSGATQRAAAGTLGISVRRLQGLLARQLGGVPRGRVFCPHCGAPMRRAAA